MLSKVHRLGARQIVVHEHGTRLGGDLLNLEVWKAEAEAQARFAVVVSKKIARNAVDRNRIKRLINEAIALILPHVISGIGVIVYAKSPIIGQRLPTIRLQLVDLFQKAHVLKS
jgi:ribonuclease P protein component